MKTITSILLVLMFWQSTAANFGLHFDDSGQIIKPDQHYLRLGMRFGKNDHKRSALTSLKKSAAYGNQNAMSLIALYHVEDQDYVAALAWFKLVDLAKTKNPEYMNQMIATMQSQLTPKQRHQSEQLWAQLKQTYGKHPTMLKRERWRNSLKYTGSNIRGHIPSFLNINLASGVIVSGENLQKQMEAFVFEYEFGITGGNVILDNIEVIDEQPDTPQ